MNAPFRESLHAGSFVRGAPLLVRHHERKEERPVVSFFGKGIPWSVSGFPASPPLFKRKNKCCADICFQLIYTTKLGIMQVVLTLYLVFLNFLAWFLKIISKIVKFADGFRKVVL